MKLRHLFTTTTLLTLSSTLFAEKNCSPTPPVSCNEDACCSNYCLGPETVASTAPVRPYTCNGDFVITVSGLYWNSFQDGMEYAVESFVNQNTFNNDGIAQLVKADYQVPDFKWDTGFKFGLGYNTTCDGWDFGAFWTWYRGHGESHSEADLDSNTTLFPIWSAFPDALSSAMPPLLANKIDAHWKLELNLLDLELGREYWNSRRLSIRPHVGLRLASICQDYELEHCGGSWGINFGNLDLNDVVTIENNFKGVGVRGGLGTVWNFGCGFGLFSELALSLLYGKFHIDHKEKTREAISPFHKNEILESNGSLRSSKFCSDLTLGLQWLGLFCDCKYAFAARLGWEHHFFANQNQMWRVIRTEALSDLLYNQRRGDLSTQGWTLSFVFDF